MTSKCIVSACLGLGWVALVWAGLGWAGQGSELIWAFVDMTSGSAPGFGCVYMRVQYRKL